MQEKITQLCADQAFTAALANCNSAEEIVALFEEHQVSMTIEEVNELLETSSVPAGGELREDDLDSVSGGASIFKFLRPILVPVIPILLPVLPRIPKVRR